MEEIISTAVYTYIGALIGLIIVICICPSMQDLSFFIGAILGLIPVSIICGVLKYFFID